MAVVKCKVEWESEGWSYIVLQGEKQLRYTKIPSKIIVISDDEKFIYVDITKDKGKSYKCNLKDARYNDYYFIKFSIRKDQFVNDEQLIANTEYLYREWCKEVLE